VALTLKTRDSAQVQLGGRLRQHPDRDSMGMAPFTILVVVTRARARRRQQTDPLDLVEPAGRCSGCWPHDGEVAGGAGEISVLVNLVGGDDGAQAVGANDDRPMLMSASPGRGGGGRAQRATGVIDNDRQIPQH
jgi:hypothetical protein